MCSASGRDVAVVEVQAERLGVELVGGRFAGLDHSQRRSRAPRPSRPGGCRGSGSCAGARSRCRSGSAAARPHARAASGPGRGRCRSRPGTARRARPRSPCRRRRAPTRAAPGRRPAGVVLPAVEVAQHLVGSKPLRGGRRCRLEPGVAALSCALPCSACVVSAASACDVLPCVPLCSATAPSPSAGTDPRAAVVVSAMPHKRLWHA